LAGKLECCKKKSYLLQADFIDKIGVSRDTIGKYERDDIEPTFEKAKKIADGLGISIDFFANEEEKKETLKHDAVAMINELQKLPEQKRNKIFEVIDSLIRDFKTQQAYQLTR
jgi:transcriptional regulator with XRE-family HTH domain